MKTVKLYRPVGLKELELIMNAGWKKAVPWTVEKFLQSIRTEGLRKMERHHVHLSRDRETAEKVGSRRGTAIILVVRSGEMNRDGFEFYLSANGVWLTEQVPVKYIED
jgi:putative RNA 2'-phosphotransferase